MRHIRNFLSNHTRPIILSLAALAFVALCFSSYYLTHASDSITLRINDGEIVVPGVDKFGTPKPFSLETKTTTANDYGYTLSAYSITDPRISITKDGGNNDCSTTVPLSTTKSAPTAIEVTTEENDPQVNPLNTVTTTYCAVVTNDQIPDGEYNITIGYHLAENQPPLIADLAQTCTPGYTASGQTLPTSAQGIVVDLDPNMIPIKYTGNTTTPQWTNNTTSNTNNTWYSYESQQWANAITVTPSSLTKYQNQDNIVVDEADVLGYWVYIPRYRYQVMRCNASDAPIPNQTALNIKFENQTGTNYEKAYPSTNGDWATHPAFTFGAQELNGLWVGKYETTGSTTAPTIKPNLKSQVYQVIGTQYNIAKSIGVLDTNATGGGCSGSYYYANNTASDCTTAPAIPQNNHNLSTTKTHQQKNSDWGAVAYLSTSTYGVYGTNSQQSQNNLTGTAQKVYINGAYSSTPRDGNNNSGYGLTGCGPNGTSTAPTDSQYTITDATATGTTNCTSSSTARAYYTIIGQLSSTTGTIYGIYDTAGGAWEYVIGNRTTSATQTTSSTSYMANPITNSNYYNAYKTSAASGLFGTKPSWSTSTSEYYYNFDVCTFATCGGQANYETTAAQSVSSGDQSWGSGLSYFVYSGSPWFGRGGLSYNGSYAGLWASDAYHGLRTHIGFRVVAGSF
jgi:hypothetical protein